jgi:methionyl-tRNA synthetase
MDAWDLTGALESIWNTVRELNRHVERSKPWELAKNEDRAADLETVLFDLADGIRAVAVALWAYLPETAPAILRSLGQSTDPDWGGVRPGGLAPASGIKPAPPLFPRIERAAEV